MGFAEFMSDVFGEMERQRQVRTQQEAVEKLRIEFGAFLDLDRGAAQQHISAIIKSASSQQLKEYEEYFLTATALLQQPDQVYRAVELYGWLKDQEHEKYGHWRGFADEK